MNPEKSRQSIRYIKLIMYQVFLVLISVGCEYIIPNKPPYVEKINPTDNAVYNIGQVVSFKVNAYDIDGTVINVVFTAPNSRAFVDDEAPYEFDWQTAGMAEGNYMVEIKAVDNLNVPYIISAPVRLLGNLAANAGKDTLFTDSRTSYVLNADVPVYNQGTWAIVSGTGGQISDLHNANATLTGLPCQSYTLRWTVSNGASQVSDDVTIVFSYQPSQANAGTDQILSNGSNFTQLSSLTPLDGSGQWTIVSGGAGSFSDAGGPNAVFTGILCHTYVLRWTVSTLCNSSFDEVTLIFNQLEISVDAGPDVRISDGSVTTFLHAKTPLAGAPGTWSIVTGEGGVVEEPNNPESMFTGIPGQIYNLKWAFPNVCFENADIVTIAFISNLRLFDQRDGQIYQSVKIGNQEWLAENLNYSMAGSIWYEDKSENASIYGRLYDWNSANSACPPDWHLPSDLDWRQLEAFLGMDAGTSLMEWYRGRNEGGMLKEEGILYWEFPNAGATNVTGFTARPGGYRTPDGAFGGIRSNAGFWTSTENSKGKAIYRALHKDEIQIGRDYYEKGYGFSVRCIKN